MQTDILIIGGGLSGLVAVWQLRYAGKNAIVMEARARFGGRILTTKGDDGADCDLGPSWFWPGQPLVAALLNHFNIPSYEQFADGAVLLQEMDGGVDRVTASSPMAGARRIQGGINRLSDAIVNRIDAAHCFLEHVVTGLSIGRDVITADVVGPAGKIQVQTKQVAVAIPPRLAAELSFMPELPLQTIRTLAATPTWMAGHAKFFAIYDEPFWREKGLCGTAISLRGPLAEIHDASPSSGNTFSLFGFSGLDAKSRANLGRSEFIRQATAQLATLFGEKANRPKEVYFQDWSTEKFTSNYADRSPQSHHPQYGLNLQLGSAWDGKLEFISTETSFSNGGLLEGALETGLKFSKRITGLNIPLIDDTYTPSTAEMSWDWL
ncbi:MAG: FAD-dependent oxidoreductase [Desulfobacterales bacterium]